VCPICDVAFKENEFISEYDCGHTYHVQCIWRITKRSDIGFRCYGYKCRKILFIPKRPKICRFRGRVPTVSDSDSDDPQDLAYGSDTEGNERANILDADRRVDMEVMRRDADERLTRERLDEGYYSGY